MSLSDAAGPPDLPINGAGSTLSVFGVGAIYLQGRRTILGLSLLGALLSFSIVALRAARYTAIAMFIPESPAESSGSSLAGLAVQYGITLGAGAGGPSPEFYASLATSSIILGPIVSDSFSTGASETTGLRPLSELLRAKGATRRRRIEQATESLQGDVEATFNRRTGTITLIVRSRWPSVSIGVAEHVLDRLNDFNLHTRQSRAKAQRMFAEGRVVEARGLLRQAEEAMRLFSLGNRSTGGSPTLRLEMERLQREISLRQQLLTALEQSYEDARLREVRDTPIITILQAPTALSVPDRRGLLSFSLLGGFAGFLVGLVLVPMQAATRQARAVGDEEARKFFDALADSRRDPLGIARPRST